MLISLLQEIGAYGEGLLVEDQDPRGESEEPSRIHV